LTPPRELTALRLLKSVGNYGGVDTSTVAACIMWPRVRRHSATAFARGEESAKGPRRHAAVKSEHPRSCPSHDRIRDSRGARAHEPYCDTLLRRVTWSRFTLRVPRCGCSSCERHERCVAHGTEWRVKLQAEHLAQAGYLLGVHAVLEGAAAFV
jgi:hypothetical protein